ncbi:phytanoyl-CoA dioxygenase family protein [bacterium]|nr:phytanoyl-CoA dioxygenase family protein [bacterium]
MSLTQEQIKTYATNGFVKLENCIPINVLDEIRVQSKKIFQKQLNLKGINVDLHNDTDFEKSLYRLFNEDYDAFIGAAKLCQHQLPIHKLAVSKEVIETIRHLGVANPSICVKPIVYFNSRHIAKQVGHYKTPAHQDWRSMQGSVNSIVVWIPLVDIDMGLGALEVIPKSHLSGILNTVKDDWYRTIKDDRFDEEKFISLEVEKGDVVCFNSFLVHRSGNNTSENIRWSMHYRYNDIDEATYVERKFPHPYIVYTPGQETLFPEFQPQHHLKKHLDGLTKI